MREADRPARDLSIKEAARALGGRSATTVRGWCQAGLMGYRIGDRGQWYITPEEIDRVRRGLPAKAPAAS